MDILQAIEEKLPSLSRGKKRIAQYILENFDRAAFQTANVLGKTVQVSESTVVRFAMELGYEGYPEMQKALQQMLRNRLTNVQRIEAGETHLQQEDPVSAVLQADIERIRKTVDTLDREAFQGAVEALLKARRIYIIGVRSSGALASFAGHYLRYMFEDVRVLVHSSESEILQHLVRISPQDVLFAISFPRYSASVTHAMRFGRDAGAKTIALTDSETSPLAKNTDFVLTANTDLVSLVDSMVAPMSVLNALIMALASRRKEETAHTFEKLEEIWDTYHVYETNDK